MHFSRCPKNIMHSISYIFFSYLTQCNIPLLYIFVTSRSIKHLIFQYIYKLNKISTYKSLLKIKLDASYEKAIYWQMKLSIASTIGCYIIFYEAKPQYWKSWRTQSNGFIADAQYPPLLIFVSSFLYCIPFFTIYLVLQAS